MNFVDFLLNNTGGDEKKLEAQTVAAPAFSITKVLTSAGAIVAPIAAIVVDWASKRVTLTMWQYIVLALGLLAFLAIVAAADMAARSYATAAEAHVKAAQANAAHLLPFKQHLSGHLLRNNELVDIVGAAEGDEPYLLVVPKEHDAVPMWERAAAVKFD